MAKRCVGCMKMKNNSPICEHCGYNENIPNYPHQLPIGTVLRDQYVVGKVLGQGGFGITYIGWDQYLETTVAIKEFYPNTYVTRDCGSTRHVTCIGENVQDLFGHNRERFLREARVLAKLRNVPGIVRVHNLFTENNTAYIIMEYVEGIDLKRYLRMRGQLLTVEEMLHVMRPVMNALIQIHKADLVHRDISPDNIMIQPDGTAKLLDFGAAREVADAEAGRELPQSTEAILKHGFAPIEQYRRRGSLGPWTDVYSLCATIYYSLTGKLPADAPERMMGDDNVDWKQISGLTVQQRSALEQGMAMLPEKRIGSVKELYEALYNRTATEYSVSLTQTQPESQPKPEPIPEPEPVITDYPVGTLPLEESIIEPIVSQSNFSSPKITESATSAAKNAAAFAKEKYNSLLPNVKPRAKAACAIALAVLVLGVGFLFAKPKNGWVEKKESTYYYVDGEKQTGMQKIDNLTYYFDSEGVMQTGWQTVDDKTYHFTADGTMLTGWQTIQNEEYFFDSHGVMLIGWQTIDGKYLFFEEDGAWVPDVWRKNVLKNDPLSYIPGIEKRDILSVTFLDNTKDAPSDSVDVSKYNSEGKILVWKEKNGRDYDIYIAADGGINAKGDAAAHLFDDCYDLERVDFNNCFHTEEATSLNFMFSSCWYLTIVDFSSFDTSNITTMDSMFEFCNSLTTLDLSSFDTSNVTNMKWMFFECDNLTTVDLSSFDTSNVTDISHMFQKCYKLKNLTLPDWDVSKVSSHYGFMDNGDTINGRPWEEFFE